MKTTYFLFVDGLKAVMWCDIREAPYRRLATAVNFDDFENLALYSPIQYGGL